MESRLARMEEKLDALIASLERREQSQDRHNELFYRARDKVNEMDARSKGAWFAVGIFSAVISFLVSFFNKG